MSEPNASVRPGDEFPVEADVIQFDEAEYANAVPAGPTCGGCQRAIVDEYYEINGKVVCASCRQAIEATFRGGSRLVRLIKALVFGSAAALVGAVLYYAFVRLTHINFGLVAVLLGVMVGGGVRKGSGNRGGGFYQLLAVFLTYSAIVGMHVPDVIEQIRRSPQEGDQGNVVAQKIEQPAEKAALQHKAPVIVKNSPTTFDADIPANPFAEAPGEGIEVKVAKAQEEGAAKLEVAPQSKLDASRLMLLLGLLVAFFYSTPVIHAVQAPISGLIYGFALWEAWKINKKVRLSFSGPFRVSTKGSDAPAPEDDNDGD